MKRKHHSDKTLDFSKARNILKDEEGNRIPFSIIDDYQGSLSKFSTRIESNHSKLKDKNKRVNFNPLISVVNIESYKKENYELTNDVIIINPKEQKCALCSIF